MNDIIPSLEGLLDQLHNIKPQQFYENQRKLKLYEIRLLEEELEMKKADLFKGVDQIINWFVQLKMNKLTSLIVIYALEMYEKNCLCSVQMLHTTFISFSHHQG